MPKWFTGLTAFIMFAAFAYAAFWQPGALLALSNLHYILAWVIIALVILPSGSLRLGSFAALPWWRWQLKIFVLQIALCVLFIAFVYAILGQGPRYVMGTLNIGTAVDVLSRFYTNNWGGFFPFIMFLFWAIFVSYFIYIKKSGPHIYHSISPVAPKRLHPLYKTATDGCLTGVNILILGLTASISLLLLLYAIEIHVMAHHLLVPTITTMTLSLFMPILLTPMWRKLLKRGLAKRFRLDTFYTRIIFLLIPVLVLAAIFNHFVFEKQPSLGDLGEIPYIKQLLSDVNTRFAALFYSWWILWVPLIGTYVAKISCGRTLRQLVCGFLFLPALFFLASKILEGNTLLIYTFQLFRYNDTFTLLSLAFINLMILRAFTHKAHSSAFFTRGFVEVKNMPESRVKLHLPSKSKGLSKYSNEIFMGVIGICMLHSIAGWYGVHIQLLAAAPMVTILCIELFFIFLVYIVRDKVWLNNKNIRPL